jgi:hypothetical protein
MLQGTQPVYTDQYGRSVAVSSVTSYIAASDVYAGLAQRSNYDAR